MCSFLAPTLNAKDAIRQVLDVNVPVTGDLVAAATAVAKALKV